MHSANYLTGTALLTSPSSHLCSFVVISFLGEEFQTPVCKRTFNPVYAPKDAMFKFPIHKWLEYGFYHHYLRLTVLDKGMFGKDLLGQQDLSAMQWFKSTAIAFEDPDNKVYPFAVEIRFGILTTASQPIHVPLISTIICEGSICIKVGFVHPHNSMTQLDFSAFYYGLVDDVFFTRGSLVGQRGPPGQPGITSRFIHQLKHRLGQWEGRDEPVSCLCLPATHRR